MKPRIAIGLLVVVAAGIVLWSWYAREGDDGRLQLYGNVDIRQVELGFRVGGRIATMVHEEGDRVAAGALLAELDAAPFEQELALVRAEYERQRATLQKLESGSRVEEIAEARARVEERAAARANAERQFQREKGLLSHNATSQQAYDAALARQQESEAQLAAARAALELALAGFRAEDVLAASAELHAAAATVAQAEIRLADTRLVAPAAGTLLTRSVEPGAIVAAGATAYVLSLDAPVWVRAYVAEPDLGRVRPGTAVEVHTDGGAVFAGQVGFVSPDAEFTPKTVQTEELRTDLVYRVRIVVAESDQRLRRGMPVTVRFAGDASGGG